MVSADTNLPFQFRRSNVELCSCSCGESRDVVYFAGCSVVLAPTPMTQAELSMQEMVMFIRLEGKIAAVVGVL